MLRPLLVAATLLLLACGGSTAGPQPTPTAGPAGQVQVTGRVAGQGQAPAEDVAIEVTGISEEVTAETVAEGLEVPWALAFTPDGRILVTERPGRIRTIRDGQLQGPPFATLDVAAVTEAGLMGMALHPDFARNGYLFVCYTYRNEAGDLRNRVARLTDAGGVGVDHRVVLDDIPGARIHDGCRLAFGPDGKLYVTMGDATDAGQAQDLDSLSGKVLRLEADGSVPADNPFPGSYVYTYGHRNPQGIDWHPATGDLFITEHGPNRDDEINILEPGGNYGWPEVTGAASDPDFVDPILSFTPPVALAGAAFYTGDRLAASWEGNLIFANLRGAHLRRVALAPPEFRTVHSQEELFEDEFGRLRAVALAPDGYLYFTTSNRDGRGNPQAGDDKVLRLVPVPAEASQVFHPDASGEFTLELAPGTYEARWMLDGSVAHQRRIVVAGDGPIDLGEIRLRTGEGDG